MVDKLMKFLKWPLIVAVSMFFLPQDIIVRDGLPAFWDAVRALYPLGRIHAHATWVEARTWLKKHLRAFWKIVRKWLMTSLALMAIGVVLKQHLNMPFGGEVVAGLGLLLLFVLTSMLLVLSKALAAVWIAWKFKKEEDATAELAQFDKYHQWITAFIVVFTALFMPFSWIVSWRALGFAVILGAPIVTVAFAIVYRRKQPGKIIKRIEKVGKVFIVLRIVDFLLDHLFPRSYGLISSERVDAWVFGWNATEATLVAIGALLLYGLCYALTKRKEERDAHLTALKLITAVALLVVGVLMYKGTLNYKDATGHKPPDLSGIHWRWPRGENKEKGSSIPVQAPETRFVPDGGQGGGVYLPPPPRSIVSAPPPVTTTSPSVRQVAVTSKPLAPKPPVPDFTDDPGAALKALKALRHD